MAVVAWGDRWCLGGGSAWAWVVPVCPGGLCWACGLGAGWCGGVVIDGLGGGGDRWPDRWCVACPGGVPWCPICGLIGGLPALMPAHQ